MTTLNDALNQTLPPRAAQALDALLAEYQRAAIVPWLIDSIAPLADELRVGLPELAQATESARQAKEAAQAAADSAQAEFEAAGGAGPVELQEHRLAAVQAADRARAEARYFSGQLGEARRRLAELDKILAALKAVEAPDPEEIRRVVRAALLEVR